MQLIGGGTQSGCHHFNYDILNKLLVAVDTCNCFVLNYRYSDLNYQEIKETMDKYRIQAFNGISNLRLASHRI